MKGHKTKKISVKAAEIDLLMIPVVEWLNGFPWTATQFCCQGNDKEEGNRPYVVFACAHSVELVRILYRLALYAKVEVHWYEAGMQIRYNAVFHDQSHLARFTDDLKRNKRNKP